MASISSRKMTLGAVLLRVGEDTAQVRLALAVELVDDLRAADAEEVRAALAGDGAGDQRLAGAGRAVEQDALGRLDAEPVEEFGVLEWQLDQLAHVLQLASEAADVLIGDLAAARRGARRRGPGCAGSCPAPA